MNNWTIIRSVSGKTFCVFRVVKGKEPAQNMPPITEWVPTHFRSLDAARTWIAKKAPRVRTPTRLNDPPHSNQ